jgi:hypothetical protein
MVPRLPAVARALRTRLPLVLAAAEIDLNLRAQPLKATGSPVHRHDAELVCRRPAWRAASVLPTGQFANEKREILRSKNQDAGRLGDAARIE